MNIEVRAPLLRSSWTIQRQVGPVEKDAVRVRRFYRRCPPGRAGQVSQVIGRNIRAPGG